MFKKVDLNNDQLIDLNEFLHMQWTGGGLVPPSQRDESSSRGETSSWEGSWRDHSSYRWARMEHEAGGDASGLEERMASSSVTDAEGPSAAAFVR